jgi:uncharacterized damage-inducible protein DinB
MRTRVTTLMGLFTCLCLVARGEPAVAQFAGSDASTSNTLRQIEDRSVGSVERSLVQAAEAMPEGKYDFVPASGEFIGVRTFARQVRHVAASNYGMASAILGEAPPVDLGSGDGPESMISKAEIVKFLQGSFAYLHRAVQTLDEKTATEQVRNPEGAGTVPKLDLATRQLWHDMDHYGQMVIYLRLNGIVPPASRARHQ